MGRRQYYKGNKIGVAVVAVLVAVALGAGILWLQTALDAPDETTVITATMTPEKKKSTKGQAPYTPLVLAKWRVEVPLSEAVDATYRAQYSKVSGQLGYSVTKAFSDCEAFLGVIVKNASSEGVVVKKGDDSYTFVTSPRLYCVQYANEERAARDAFTQQFRELKLRD